MKKNNKHKSDNHYLKRKYFAMPDAFIIIFGIALLSAIATYIIPAGLYEREEVDGITQAIPGSFSFTESNPTSLMDLFLVIQYVMLESGIIIFLFFFLSVAVSIFIFVLVFIV